MTTGKNIPGDHAAAEDAASCPLCGGCNDCQMCSADAYKGSCWCVAENIPDELLACVPAHLRNRACICRACVAAFHQRETGPSAPAMAPGGFYFEPGGLMVFTEAYHLRRGYCCGSGCRHCPYAERLHSGHSNPR